MDRPGWARPPSQCNWRNAWASPIWTPGPCFVLWRSFSEMGDGKSRWISWCPNSIAWISIWREREAFGTALNGMPLSPDIRSEEVGLWASHLGRIPVVRDFLRRNQQAIGRITSLVAEGRDMGSVVFPTARHKFFMDASIDVRAKRRHVQLQEMGMQEDLNASALRSAFATIRTAIAWSLR